MLLGSLLACRACLVPIFIEKCLDPLKHTFHKFEAFACCAAAMVLEIPGQKPTQGMLVVGSAPLLQLDLFIQGVNGEKLHKSTRTVI